MATTAFGRFLELSLPTPDIRESMDFYRRLGFSELAVNDIRSYHYGVVSDGRIAIGLHAGGIDSPALSFVQADVAATVPPMMSPEDTLSFARLGEETFHEIGIHSPENLLIVMMESRTFSRADLSDLPAPFIGPASEISLGYRDIKASIAFWTGAGLTTSHEVETTAETAVEILAPGLKLGLRPALRPGDIALRFIPQDLDETFAALEVADIAVRRRGDQHCIMTPENIPLELIAEDKRD